jgi:uncharacterized iron-regulated protein
MKKICLLSAFLVIRMFITAVNTDTLPIGPSVYKFNLMPIGKGEIVETGSRKKVTIEDIVKKNLRSRVFIIGEYHDSFECHTFQRDFIEALFRQHPRLVVGFEFFTRQDDEVLERWRTANISEEELLKKTGWYARNSLNYGYTRPIMETIRQHKIKVVGLNLPRKIVHQVSSRGFDSLSAQDKKLFPTIHHPNPDHEFYIQSQFGDLAVQLDWWFRTMYQAQKCWDVVMAESMRRVLAQREYRGYKGIIIAGSAHVAYWLGIPFRYQKADRNVKLTTLIPVYLPGQDEEEKDDEEQHPMLEKVAASLEPAAVFSRGLGDYVFSVPRPQPPHFPSLGFSGKMKEGLYVVSRVKKESLAEKHGLEKGDTILAVDDTPIESEEQLRSILSHKNWDDPVALEIKKKIEIKKQQ